MVSVLRLSVLTAFCFVLGACATQPPPPPDYPPPPGPRRLDAKTQLETGRRY